MPAFEFVRSSYSGGNAGQECVEIARNIPGTVAVRDSKKTRGPVLRFAASVWGPFHDGVRAGTLR
ncbi:DUF397 domain-containing protein [Streptomyces griseorubiginosus]|uniref:DUF397 domain-containing protein n=1 Tax=Streptomyces griseorubiginosus TaxID=67304 RepID=UPI001AD67593|nr:DUF397 domain-containing protein [Streptomyces griseorubiginosus]MBO4257551.1 DUF397 domain-containing protein [Streptomyces griseorubiginosus]